MFFVSLLRYQDQSLNGVPSILSAGVQMPSLTAGQCQGPLAAERAEQMPNVGFSAWQRVWKFSSFP